MIIIQILLVGVLLLLFWWFIARASTYHVRAWTKLFMIFFVFLAIIVIVFPDSSNRAAHWVGISRGADLLLYLLTLAFIFVVLSGYIRGKEEQKRIVKLARRVALLEAELRHKK